MIENLERAHCYLQVLFVDYFRNGVIGYPNAYAYTCLAMILIEDCLGIDDHDDLVEEYLQSLESTINYSSMIFPRDEVIRKQINDLELLLSEVEGSVGDRDVLISVGDAPCLSLVKPKAKEK